jgi:thymidylate kinase
MSKLVVLEGTDLSGKTTIAKEVAKRMNFEFDHEPTFSSSFADKINFTNLNEYQREFYFLVDRYNHQDFLTNNNVILDRYRLSSIAYTNVFSEKALEMSRSINSTFLKPDLTVYIDMQPENAIELNESRKGTDLYNSKLTLKKLQQLRLSFYKQIAFAQSEWDENIIIYEPIYGNLSLTINQIYDLINKEIS